MSESASARVRLDMSSGAVDERRGFVGYVDGKFVHYCPVCGQWGAHGYNYFPRQSRLGVWFCGTHRPQSKGTKP
jgi:hypothetical protein